MGNIMGLLKSAGGEFGIAEFLLSVVFSLVAGIICMLLYRLYFHMTFDRNESLTRSFVIIAPSISAIFWAIQYSLPLSLGLLGALSFVRFRTPIKKAEDIGFILLVIALSLLSSVFRFYAAGALLCIIAVVVFVKSFVIDRSLSFLGAGSQLTAFISTDTKKIEEMDAKIRTALARAEEIKGARIELCDVVTKESGYNLRYSFLMKRGADTAISSVIGTLNELDNVQRVEVFNGRAV